MSPDQLDKAIKRSAMDEPPYEGRKSAPRLEGEDKDTVVATVVEAMDVNQNYDHVLVFDYPAYDECFNFMLVNFYYTQDVDPTTRIAAYRVWSDGKVTTA